MYCACYHSLTWVHPLFFKSEVQGQFELLRVPYLSPVLHLAIPICQPFTSLLLLSEGFLGLCAQILNFNDFADLFASFGGAFTVARLPVAILIITLLKHRKDPQATRPLDTRVSHLFLTLGGKIRSKTSLGYQR